MRIVLIYPPPWKIEQAGEPPFPPGEGGPAGIGDKAALGGDFVQAPSGLLSIAAQALSAGHEATVLNLSDASWRKVQISVRRRHADLFGLSCVTANRRGVFMTADLIRETFPESTLVVGGPHVTALPVESLRHCPALDAVVLGEGEATFMEIVERLGSGSGIQGTPGTAWQENGGAVIGPPRPPIDDLDRLVDPLLYFSMRKIITSRGCPGKCTFCCSRLMWGRRVRFHSAGYVLDMIARAVGVHRRKMISFKDDTFTADRDRVIDICDAIRMQGLDFVWSCETRADHLDEEMLRAMRRAGCQRISIGVESASPQILKNIRKRITPSMVVRTTRQAQKFGIRVRYYMMVGNRGETFETFRQSLDFIREARPDQFVFTQLHLYPGTDEFAVFRDSGVVAPDIYFDRDFAHLTCFAGKQADADRVLAVLKKMEGIQECREPTVSECRRVLDQTGELAAARLDLCSALIREGRLDAAEKALQRVRGTGFCLPGLIYNCLACIAAGRGRIASARAYLEKAITCHPHQVVVDNILRLPAEEDGNGTAVRRPLQLDARLCFETCFLRFSPEFPDPDPARDTAAVFH